MNRTGDRRLAGILLTFACLLAMGSKTIEVGVPTPKTVLHQFYSAVAANDLAAAKALAVDDPLNQQCVENVTGWATSVRLNLAATTGKFGEAAVKRDVPPILFIWDPSYYEYTTENTNGDTASVGVKARGMPGAPVPLRRVNGAWKVDINSIAKLAQDPKLIEMMDATVSALEAEARKVAAEITAGQYATAPEAMNAGGSRLAKVFAEKAFAAVLRETTQNQQQKR